MAGNHDRWLCPFYERALGAEIIEEPADRLIHGLRVRMVHGHRLGARRLWKAAMESRAFFRAFGWIPRPIATGLDHVLAWKNERGLLDDEERHLKVYRTYAASCRDVADLVVIGHVHRPVDEVCDGPRLIVLGGWQHRSSYLRIDESGACFHVVPDDLHPAERLPRTVEARSRTTDQPRDDSDPPGPTPMKFDHHVHTARHSPDSSIDPLKLIERAREIGLDGLVITEHDYQWEAGELSELARLAAPLRVFSGAEVSAREGHFLVYGLPSVDEVPPGIRLADLLRVVRAHDAAIVAAHPFRWDQPFDAIVAEHGPAFDALELVSKNVTRETRAKTEAVLRRHKMGATGSSDSHEVETVGCYFTEFDRPIRTIQDFAAALRARRGRPRHRPGVPLSSGPVSWEPKPDAE